MTPHPGNAVNGFAKSGLCPFDMTRIPKSKIMLSETMEPAYSSMLVTDMVPQVASSSSAHDQTPSRAPQVASSSSAPDQTPSRAPQFASSSIFIGT